MPSTPWSHPRQRSPRPRYPRQVRVPTTLAKPGDPLGPRPLLVRVHHANVQGMQSVGYVRVSTDRQAEAGGSLEAQAEKLRAMAVVHGAELLETIVDGGESAKSM